MEVQSTKFMSPEQNGRHTTENYICTGIYVNEKFCTLIKIS